MSLTLMQAHAMVMIIAWMTFGSTGILFARYGRSLRCGRRRQLLGKAVWFQIHRLLLSLTALLTLLGFLLILVRRGGQWTNPQTGDVRAFIHSIFGGIIVCCCIVQVWLTLYRCHPQSRFRFIFDWSHRITGLLAFSLAIPAIFLIVVVLAKFIPELVPIYSCWTAWMVLAIIVLEKIRYSQQSSVLPAGTVVQIGEAKREDANVRLDAEAGSQTNAGNRRYDQVKILLLFIHIIISVVLSAVFIAFMCK